MPIRTMPSVGNSQKVYSMFFCKCSSHGCFGMPVLQKSHFIRYFGFDVRRHAIYLPAVTQPLTTCTSKQSWMFGMTARSFSIIPLQQPITRLIHLKDSNTSGLDSEKRYLSTHSHIRGKINFKIKEVNFKSNSCQEKVDHRISDEILSKFIDKAISQDKHFKSKRENFINNPQIFISTLENLIAAGCKVHELMEAPSVLFYPENEIQARISKLRKCGIHRVSMPLLFLADPGVEDRTIIMKVKKYFKVINFSSLSMSGYYQHLLGVSDEDLVQMLIKRPGIVRPNSHKVWKEKFQYLLLAGMKGEEIVKCTSKLGDSLATINEKIVKRKALNLFDGRSWYTILNTAVSELDSRSIKRSSKSENLQVSREELAELLNLEPDQLDLLPRSLSSKPTDTSLKVKYLISRGYTDQQILQSPVLLSNSLETIVSAYTELIRLGVDVQSLSTLEYFIKTGEVIAKKTTYKCGRIVAKVLEVPLNKLNNPHGWRIYNTQKPRDVMANFAFLQQTCGFSTNDLRVMPHVLLHETEVLQKTWAHMKQHTQFEKWKADPVLLINVLQYFCEKSLNFKHIVAK